MGFLDDIERIQNAKKAIRDLIVARGISVDESVLIDEYPALIENSFSSSMDFYKCAAVHEAVEGACYVVSGCPTEAANGTYLLTEYTAEDLMGDKHPVYSNGTHYYYYNSYMSWVIGSDYDGQSTNGILYMCGSNGGVGATWADYYSADQPIDGMTMTESTVASSATWDGYKAIFKGNYYYFEETVTEGLSYLGNVVEIDKIYSSNGLIEIANLFNGLLSEADGNFTLVVDSDSTYDESTGTLILNDGSVDENGVLSLNA